jgi:hypothetical protein
LPVYDPLPNYSRRYDTWREAERGHRATLESIRQYHAEVQAAARRRSPRRNRRRGDGGDSREPAGPVPNQCPC